MCFAYLGTTNIQIGFENTSKSLCLFSSTVSETGSVYCGLVFGSGDCWAASTHVSNRMKESDGKTVILQLAYFGNY